MKKLNNFLLFIIALLSFSLGLKNSSFFSSFYISGALILSLILLILLIYYFANYKEKLLLVGNNITAVIFLIIIFIPSLFLFIGLDKNNINNKIEFPAVAPILNTKNFYFDLAYLQKYPENFETALTVNFPFKTKIVTLYSHIMMDFFHVSPNNRVIIGKEGWFFYDDSSVPFSDFEGKNLFDKQTLEKIVNYFVTTNNDLKKMNKRFVYIISPQKETIYFEFMPKNFKQASFTKTDQLIEALKASFVPVIDLRKVLIANKNTELLYTKNDTHWNTVGAYYVFQTILQELGIPYPTRDSLEFNTTSSVLGNDITHFLLSRPELSKDVLKLKSFTLNNKKYEVKDDMENDINNEHYITQNKNGRKERILFFSDSYTLFLQPFFSSYFSYAGYHLGHTEKHPFFIVNIEDVKKEKADIVIMETAERLIGHLPSFIDQLEQSR